MKETILTFAFVLVASCLMLSAFQAWGWMEPIPPQNMGAGVGNINEGSTGTSRADFAMPEINLDATSRDAGYATTVKDQSGFNLDFPTSAGI